MSFAVLMPSMVNSECADDSSVELRSLLIMAWRKENEGIGEMKLLLTY